MGDSNGLAPPKLTAAISKLPTLLDPPRAELGRLCRRICLSYEQDRDLVRDLEGEFMQALAEVRSTFPDCSLGEDDLFDIIREEETRVATAVVTAELLLPKISAVLKQQRPLPGPVAAGSVARTGSPSGDMTRASGEPLARTATPGIADLLQGMIEQENREVRSRSSTSRP